MSMKEFTIRVPRLLSALIFSLFFSFMPDCWGVSDSITVTAPNGSERWLVGSIHNITWSATLASGQVRIEYSSNGGTNWSVFRNMTPNDGVEQWTVPDIPSAMCLVRVSDGADGSPSDVSDSWFRVEPSGSVALITTKTSGEVYVSFLSGQSGADSEIGFGYAIATTPATNRYILFQDLPHDPSPTTAQTLGYLPAGTGLDFYVITTGVVAYSGFRLLSNPSDAFYDKDNSLGWGGSVVEERQIGVEDYLLHLDRATGGIDDDNDFLIEVKIVPVGESPPVAVVQTPAGVQSGNVQISYTLKDVQGDECRIEVQFSEDGGVSWHPATSGSGGDGTEGLTSSRTGQNHVFVWDSVTDIGLTRQNDIRIRITPWDTEKGTPGETSNFTVDNVPPPELSCLPDSFFFEAVENGSNPANQPLEVWNSGGGVMDWRVDDDAPWLTLMPARGQSAGERDSVSVSVSIAGLGHGAYNATITVSSLQLPDSPIHVPVKLTVREIIPELSVSPKILQFSAWEGFANPPPQYLEVKNASGGEMPWQLWPDLYWVSVSPQSGSSSGEVDLVEVSVDITDLEAGSYSARIKVEAQAPNSPCWVTVLLELTPPPPLSSVSPSVITMECVEGEDNPPPARITVRNVGTGEFSWQASEDASWLSISPKTGSTVSGTDTIILVQADSTGLLPGAYGATVIVTDTTVNSPHEVEVTLLVKEKPPTLSVSPTSLSFSAFEGEDDPAPQQLTVENAGRGDMDWKASEDIAWLELSPQEGSSSGEPDAIQVSVDIAGLTVGSYEGFVTLSSTNAVNSPVVVSVFLEISEPPPSLEVFPEELAFVCVEGADNPLPQGIRVRNAGGREMTWNVVSDAEWLLVSPESGSSSGGEAEVVEVSVDASGLSAGDYCGNLTVTAPDAGNSPEVVRVSLTVEEPPPVLSVSPSSLSFSMEEGDPDPTPQTFGILNTGGRTMEWQASADAEWLALAPEEGSNTGDVEPVEVSVSAQGMAVGNYSATIEVEAPGAENSPQTVSVALEVKRAKPELHVSPDAVEFVTRRGGENPPDKTITITARCRTTMTWVAEEDASWLRLSHYTDTNGGEDDVVTVSVNKSWLDLGEYECEVVIRDSQEQDCQVSVQVVLRVVPIRVPQDEPTIQDAIDVAEARDVILVAAGRYREKIRMKSNIEVIGQGAEDTVLDCAGEGTAVAFVGVEWAKLQGLTVTGGTAEPFGKSLPVGGGIYIFQSSAVISQCHVVANSAALGCGGGICIDEDSDPLILDCELCHNSALIGGGIFCYEDTSATILTSRISGNSAEWHAGGIYQANSSSVSISGCEVCANEAARYAGGICLGSGSDCHLVSCTLADNSSPEGAAIFTEKSSSIEALNCIVWGNSSPMVLGGKYVFRNCDTEFGELTGTYGNISADPFFMGDGDYHLLPCSPCIDAGSNFAAGLPPGDLDGEDRIMPGPVGDVTDMGADEVNPDVPVVLVDEISPSETGLVRVSFALFHVLSFPCAMTVEYSIGVGGGWRRATRSTEGEGTCGLSSSPGGEGHIFVWDSVVDEGALRAQAVRLRLTPKGPAQGNSCISQPFPLDNREADADDDRLPDAWEQMIVEFDPQDGILSPGEVLGQDDYDGDGSFNRNEYLAGTDPVDADSYLRVACAPCRDGEVVVSWPSIAGRIYRILYCDGMGNGWHLLGEPVTGTGERIEFQDATAKDAILRFYRVEVE